MGSNVPLVCVWGPPSLELWQNGQIQERIRGAAPGFGGFFWLPGQGNAALLGIKATNRPGQKLCLCMRGEPQGLNFGKMTRFKRESEAERRIWSIFSSQVWPNASFLGIRATNRPVRSDHPARCLLESVCFAKIYTPVTKSPFLDMVTVALLFILSIPIKD